MRGKRVWVVEGMSMAEAQVDHESVAGLFYEAVRQVMSGDAEPMLELFSTQDDVSYSDPDGRAHKGREQLVAYWRRAAELNRATPGAVQVQADVIAMQGGSDLLSTFMAERITVQSEGQTAQFTAVATNVYRREGQQWRMVHRHSGAPAPEN